MNHKKKSHKPFRIAFSISCFVVGTSLVVFSVGFAFARNSDPFDLYSMSNVEVAEQEVAPIFENSWSLSNLPVTLQMTETTAVASNAIWNSIQSNAPKIEELEIDLSEIRSEIGATVSKPLQKILDRLSRSSSKHSAYWRLGNLSGLKVAIFIEEERKESWLLGIVIRDLQDPSDPGKAMVTLVRPKPPVASTKVNAPEILVQSSFAYRFDSQGQWVGGLHSLSEDELKAVVNQLVSEGWTATKPFSSESGITLVRKDKRISLQRLKTPNAEERFIASSMKSTSTITTL